MDSRNRVGTWLAKGFGLLFAFAFIGLGGLQKRRPSEKKLRALATSEQARSRRAEEEEKIHSLIARLAEVEGLEHVLTRFSDHCYRPNTGPFEGRPMNTLICSMEAVAYFGVRGDLADVLPRIRAAGIATWGPQREGEPDHPHATGTVRYALAYHRSQGRDPDGRLMPGPDLRAKGLEITWDRPDAPLVNLVEEPRPCPPPRSGDIYARCSVVPQMPTTVAAARARYGTVLAFSLGTWGSSAHPYFTVPRRS
ncbi:hypothetical protein [Kitasatospora sp. NPDC058218]|uniref:hypothetical protein n=1 Tax=Kitasatospora sp. NPDC058218 TaxID=3346385 RepID=UPI0036DB9FFA